MFVSDATYLEALLLLLGDSSDRTKALVNEFMTIDEKNDKKKEIVGDNDNLISVYKLFIKTILVEDFSVDNKTASSVLLLKIKTNEVLRENLAVRDLLTDVVSCAEPITPKQIDNFTKKIRSAIILNEIDEVNRKIFAKNRIVSEIQDTDIQVAEVEKLEGLISELLQGIQNKVKIADSNNTEDYISLSDPASIERALTTFMERNIKGVIKPGLQGLGRALGKRGGFGLGELFIFAACSHHFKSGMLLLILLWSIIHNKFKADEGKKPLIYFISLENETNKNLVNVMKVVFPRVEGRPLRDEDLEPEKAVKWLSDYFGQFDVTVVIDKYAPHEFTFNKYVQRYNHFVDNGFQMFVFDLDYMSEADGDENRSQNGKIYTIRENYTKFRHHASDQGYFLPTGHQLTKEAERIAKEPGKRNPVRYFHPGLMADTSDAHRIADGLAYLHLETNLDGHKFLTAQVRKNRGAEDTPEAHKFFAYPFTENGIEDDIDGAPQYVTDIDMWSPEIVDGREEAFSKEDSLF